VVHPDPGLGGGEPIGDALARFDGAHGGIGGECFSMEVDAVLDGGVVDQGDLEDVADPAV